MKYLIDKNYLIDSFQRIINIPSPVGYYRELNPVLENMAKELNLTITRDNRSTTYITVPGQNPDKTIMVGAHADTLGMMVYKIEKDGKLRVRQLGGCNFNNLEGETVYVHTRDGRRYSGLFACQSHSVHVFEDARSLERNESTMVIILDEDISSKEDVQALGISNGDFVSIDPRMQLTENGYLKSRFIDDKGAIACCFAALKYLKDNHLQPSCNVIFAIPYNEEIGFGGTYIPEGVSEYLAIDIGLIGPDLEGNEHSVSICTKDNSSPYDYELTNRIIECAKVTDTKYAVDVFYRYGTDGNAAMRAGNNLRAAAFGMAVYCSHGMERTHMDGLIGTANILLEYLLNN